jgi:hypothetical protein
MEKSKGSVKSDGESLYFMPDEHLVGALGLNMTWLLALVASTLAGSLGWAVT